ncbi:MAG: CAP domain-containing protein [Planctomycetaceae bacterium]
MVAATTCLILCTAGSFWADAHTDYFAAYRDARDSKKMLLIDIASGFDFNQVSEKTLSSHVLCRVPADYSIESEGTSKKLLDFPAFKALNGEPGLIVVDFRNKGTMFRTVSVLPRRHLSKHSVETLLTLPAGTLTQRTLVWAFRVRPEQPRGVFGQADATLMSHASNHSQTQASYNSMHHAGSFPGSFEIVAQSWSQSSIVDAAKDLVALWASSPAHWGAACTGWSGFGCDMKSNGSGWYGTGVFR